MLLALFKHWSYRVFAPGTILRKTYEAFQRLLAYDSRSHELMAELESLYYQGQKEDFTKICQRYKAFAGSVNGMVASLEEMEPGAYGDLPAYFRKFDFYARFFLAPPATDYGHPFVLQFSDEDLSDKLCGSKTARLVELGTVLNFNVPAGFVITTNSFHYLLEYNHIRPIINGLLSKIDLNDIENLSNISAELVTLITRARIPEIVQESIIDGSRRMKGRKQTDGLFAVRSSALSEDGQCSFAGQYASYMNVSEKELLKTYLKVLSSKYSPQALTYRINCGLSDEEAPMAVMVLEMVAAAAAGVIYTTDPSGIEKERLFIHASKGLGEAVVSGKVIPKVYCVDKRENRLIEENGRTRFPVASPLTESQVLGLSRKGLETEKHFQSAQDIEWAVREDGSIIFLQSRPLQIASPGKTASHSPSLPSIEPLLVAGVMAASGVGSGRAWCPDDDHPLEDIEKGSILIVSETLPSYARILHLVNGVIAGKGSAAGHLATVCREFAVPLLLGVGDGISRIKHGQELTLAADETTVYPKAIALARKTPLHEQEKNLPFYRKLRSMLDFITPLRLVDPSGKDFSPEACRSLHDIIRFAHEMAVQRMFSIGDRWGGKRGVKKRLHTNLPFEVFLVDVGGGLDRRSEEQDIISLDQIFSTPFLALWKGFNHPDISWGEQKHYDWKKYDQLAMSDAFVFQSSVDSASYAVLGKKYLNINIRFGYHFTVVDALCEQDPATNYCTLRFAGGGGDFSGRELRILFLRIVLQRLGFEVKSKGELLDARLSAIAAETLLQRLESLGKLLGITKQMDMRLKDESMVEEQVTLFFQNPESVKG